MLKKLQEIMDGNAAHALVRLWSDELSEPEAMAVHNRGQADPGYREELDGLLAVFDSIGNFAGDHTMEAIVAEHRRLLHKRRTTWRVALGMATVMLLAISASLAVFAPWRTPDDSHVQEFFTRIGEQQAIALEDGSVITLNTAGKVVVDYNEQARRVLLERGEAFFDVAKEPGRPFTVEMGTRSVTAVGTKFNIRKHPGHYEIAVIEGALALHESTPGVPVSPAPSPVDGREDDLPASSQHLIKAGWVAEFDFLRNRLRAFRPESMDRYRDWVSGALTFYREPLGRVIEELNRYTRTEILIEDAAVMDLTVYTTASIDEIDSVLAGLEELLPIKVTRHYDRIVITGSDGN